jgi:hypothetical protein
MRYGGGILPRLNESVSCCKLKALPIESTTSPPLVNQFLSWKQDRLATNYEQWLVLVLALVLCVISSPDVAVTVTIKVCGGMWNRRARNVTCSGAGGCRPIYHLSKYAVTVRQSLKTLAV